MQFWGEHFHEAFFDNPHDDFDKALLKTHQLFLADSKLHSDDVCIDIGCGIGSFSRFVAANIGCKVLGVNISDYQLKKARKLTKDKKVDNVLFKNVDIMQLDKKVKRKFDGAFFIDVGCHLPDKKKALKNIYQVLNKGSRVVMTDWLQRNSLNSFEKELLIEPFNHYWNYPYMESFEGYKKHFKKIGFKIIKAQDVTELTKKNWDMFYDISLREINNMTLKKMISSIKNPSILMQGKKPLQIAKNQFYANIFSKLCCDAGVFRYGYFVLEK